MSQYEPVYDAINPDPPTEFDRRMDETLLAYSSKEIALESDEEMQHRNQILAEVKRIFQDWVKYVALEVLNLPEDEAQEAGGQLFVSGSHRLGVREPGADIDTVCVAPRFCTREHFFSSLKDRFQANPNVKNLNSIPNAAVPIMSFDFQSVSIDLLFAGISENSVPENIDIFDDKILRNLDTKSEKSLNGPRVTYMISRLVPNFDNFLIVLRCIRKWAKVKGLYGNKLGYLGGVNLNILVAFVCQLYPKASPSSLLVKFFKVYHQWRWPNPIKLNHIKLLPPHDEIWSAERFPYHAMPIITPAYPAMNSSANISERTRAIIQQEITMGYECVQTIVRSNGKGWEKLFSPSDFFVRYDHYLCCNIIAKKNHDEARSWVGFVESRIRRLPEYLSELPSPVVHFYPVKFPTSKSELSHCYFIGFDVDLSRFKGTEDRSLYIDRFIDDFRNEIFFYHKDAEEEFSFVVEHFRWKQLPEEVFESLGGRAQAKLLRREIMAGKDKSKGKDKGRREATTPGGGDASVSMKKVEVTKDEDVGVGDLSGVGGVAGASSVSMSMSMPMSTPDKRLEDDSVDVDEADTGTGKKRRVSLVGPESGGRELERKKSTGEASPTVADFNYWSNSDVAVLSSTSLQRSRRMPYKKYNVSWILLDSK